MDLSESNPEARTVTINDPVAFLLNEEKITIPFHTLSPEQKARLLMGYAAKCRVCIRSAGKSLKDYAKIVPGVIFSAPLNVFQKTRVFQISCAWQGERLDGIQPKTATSRWEIHAVL